MVTLPIDFYIVLLETGVWLALGDGDPPRALTVWNAAQFNDRQDAAEALRMAREFHPFTDAKIQKITYDGKHHGK